MVPITAFLPYVLPSCLGATEPLALQAILSACIDFSDRTPGYLVDEPTDLALARVLRVGYGDNVLGAVAAADVERPVALRGAVDGVTVPAGTPRVYYQRLPTDVTIYLYPTPDRSITEGVYIKAAYLPTRTATTVDDVLFDSYAEAIAAGAVSTLMALPGQSFTSQSGAEANSKRYESGVASAAGDAARGLVRVARYVTPRSFT
jgi:hypothetical protein